VDGGFGFFGEPGRVSEDDIVTAGALEHLVLVLTLETIALIRPRCLLREEDVVVALAVALVAVSFSKIASETPFLWTGMKDASAESRKMWYMKLHDYPKSCSRCL